MLSALLPQKLMPPATTSSAVRLVPVGVLSPAVHRQRKARHLLARAGLAQLRIPRQPPLQYNHICHQIITTTLPHSTRSASFSPR